jgi:hypothetical protein
MIQAKELRIGNLFLFTDEPKGIRSITGSHIEYAERYNGWFNSFFEPILITEEWLLKFGATKYNDNRFYLDLEKEGTLQLFFWNIGDDYIICEFSSRSEHVCYFNDHKYVHQLQNLYFALTQKELTII